MIMNTIPIRRRTALMEKIAQALSKLIEKQLTMYTGLSLANLHTN